MQDLTEQAEVDQLLLKKFESEIKSRVPHREGSRVVNATPLVDITDALIECAKAEYGLDISAHGARILGKFESGIFGGSVKVRPAVEIIGDAIASGKFRLGQTIFEATSGNFGIALGLLAKLGLDVVALVSRKLQDGVLEELRSANVKTVDLDVDICPAPGMKMEPNVLVAKAVASNMRERFGEFGLDLAAYDDSRAEIEALLARQDVIILAKFLAGIYGGFCPEQYDNELNIKAHETLTGPEIDEQLQGLGHSLADFKVVCTFGTGGTSGGLSRYIERKFGKRLVNVVFPLNNQDVAGIRTKGTALGLRFYEPERYSGQHEADFEAARRLLRFFVKKGYDIGESSALSLYAVLQMLNYGAGDKFVVILADGIRKYEKSLEIKAEEKRSPEVTVQEASSNSGDYAAVIWTHPMFTPRKEGIELIVSKLGIDERKVSVVSAKEVAKILTTQEIPDGLTKVLPREGKVLLVCMAGGTSLQVAELLEARGINADSLTGGITTLAASSGRQPMGLVQVAKD
jgi:cysteine synthase